MPRSAPTRSSVPTSICLKGLSGSMALSTGADLDLQAPGPPVRLEDVTLPDKGLRADLGERPTDGPALAKPHLHDVVALPHALEIDPTSGDRVPPGRPPRLCVRVEDAHGRAVPVERRQGRGDPHGALVTRRSDPHVLHGAPLECPPEVDLEACRRCRVSGEMALKLTSPASDEASVRVRMRPKARMRPLRNERFENVLVHASATAPRGPKPTLLSCSFTCCAS